MTSDTQYTPKGSQLGSMVLEIQNMAQLTSTHNTTVLHVVYCIQHVWAVALERIGFELDSLKAQNKTNISSR